MFKLTVENTKGEQLQLTNNPAYTITDIDGFDPPQANINMTQNAGIDGSEYNSAYVQNRQLIITMVVNSPAEVNRIALYKYFKTKYPIKVYYENNTRQVFISGYVQNMSVGYFDKIQTVQITILCPKPWFNGMMDTAQEMTGIRPLFEFPFSIAEAGIPFSEIVFYVEKSIINYGDVKTGVTIAIQARGEVENPKIYNVITGESMVLDITMQAGDTITVNTKTGEKSITLLREGVRTNIIGSLAQGSTWFQLDPGDNLFLIDADELLQNLFVVFYVTDQYEGV